MRIEKIKLLVISARRHGGVGLNTYVLVIRKNVGDVRAVRAVIKHIAIGE